MSEDLDRLLELKRSEPGERSYDRFAALSPQGRWLLRAFLGFLGITVLVGLFAILVGDMGKFEGQVLLSTVTISLGSLCGLASFEYSRRSGNGVFGGTGVLLALVASALILGGIWGEPTSDDYWKATAILAVFAAASAHFFGLCLARLKPRHQWILVTGAVAIFALAAVIAALILEQNANDGTYKLIAVLAVVDLAATLAVPILHRLDSFNAAITHVANGSPSPERFLVTLQADGTYLADNGVILVRRDRPTNPG